MSHREREKPWMQDDIDALARMWAAGMPTREIGAAMGRSKNSVIGKVGRTPSLAHRPSPLSKRYTPPSVWTPDRVARLRAMRMHGMTHREISAALGDVTRSSVECACRTYSVESPVKLRAPPVPRAPRVPKPAPPPVVLVKEPAAPEGRQPYPGVGRCMWPSKGSDPIDVWRSDIWCGEPATHYPCYCAAHHRRSVSNSTAPQPGE